MAGTAKKSANAACRIFKYIYSSLLLVFSITLIVGNIFNLQTRLSIQTHPAVALVVMLISIVWLTMVEGGQGTKRKNTILLSVIFHRLVRIIICNIYPNPSFTVCVRVTNRCPFVSSQYWLSFRLIRCSRRSWTGRSGSVQGKPPHVTPVHLDRLQGRQPTTLPAWPSVHGHFDRVHRRAVRSYARRGSRRGTLGSAQLDH